MQPPTETTPPPHGDEAELFRRHHRNLQRAVANAVNAPRELIEDACQTAWAILVRTQPDGYAIFAWLRVVAIHEAYRLKAIERRETRLARLRADHPNGEDLVADPHTLDDALEALEALRALAELPPRQRVDLSLSRSPATPTTRSTASPAVGRSPTSTSRCGRPGGGFSGRARE